MGRPSKRIEPKSGKRIKKMLRIAGLTQTQLAEETGITGRSISKWITGNGNISEYNARKICSIVNEHIAAQNPDGCGEDLYFRPEWILGYDDYSTSAEIKGFGPNSSAGEMIKIHDLITEILKIKGYETAGSVFEFENEQMLDFYACRRPDLEDLTGTITTEDGLQTSLTWWECFEMMENISAYIDLQITQRMRFSRDLRRVSNDQ